MRENGAEATNMIGTLAVRLSRGAGLVLGFVFDETIQRTDADGDEWQPEEVGGDMLDAHDAYHDLIVLARNWLEADGGAD